MLVSPAGEVREAALNSTGHSMCLNPSANGGPPSPPPKASLSAGSLSLVGSEAHLSCSAPTAPDPANGTASAALKAPVLSIIKTR